MAAGIFNGSVYHGFVVGDDGTLFERWGSPPTSWGQVPNSLGRFDPSYPLAVRRLTNDKGEVIIPGAYFVIGRAHDNHQDPVIAVWTGSGWNLYGG